MTTDIFIVSVGKHFNHLKYALRSIGKFASGFNKVLVLIPTQDADAFKPMADEYKGSVPLKMETFAEWPGQGMLHHMYAIMNSDSYFPDADIVMHFDSDWVFTEPVTPGDFLVNNKPLIVYGSFDWLIARVQANLQMWQEATINAIGKPVLIETMRWPRLIFWKDLYPVARSEIESHTKKSLIQFMREQRNEWPQSFCEYVTLGNVAWRHHRDKYEWRDQQTQGFLEPWKVYQAWSHEPPKEKDIAEYRRLGLV